MSDSTALSIEQMLPDPSRSHGPNGLPAGYELCPPFVPGSREHYYSYLDGSSPDECEPERSMGMFSPHGDLAVLELVESIEAELSKGITPALALAGLSALSQIATLFGEVGDTAVRESVCYHLEHAVIDAGISPMEAERLVSEAWYAAE